MKLSINIVKATSLALIFLLAGHSFANPQGTSVKQTPNHILLVKENGVWTLSKGDQIAFPENETDGFKIIKLKTNGADAAEEAVINLNGNEIIGNGNNPPNYFSNQFGANQLTQMLDKAIPYLPTIARAAAGAGLIALGLKFGGVALSVGIIAGLNVMGMPIGAAVALAGIVTCSTTPEQPSMLGNLFSKIPWVGSWFAPKHESSIERYLDVLERLNVPTRLPAMALNS